MAGGKYALILKHKNGTSIFGPFSSNSRDSALNAYDAEMKARRDGYEVERVPLFPPRAYPSFTEHEAPAAKEEA